MEASLKKINLEIFENVQKNHSSTKINTLFDLLRRSLNMTLHKFWVTAKIAKN